jgi:hypothetical protein
MNIAPDINCPTCGPVIICPHTAPTPSGRWSAPAGGERRDRFRRRLLQAGTEAVAV